MRKSPLPILLVIILMAGLAGWFRGDFRGRPLDRASFEQVRFGLSVDEVQDILGPGTLVNPDDVPYDMILANRDEATGRASVASSSASPSTTPDNPRRARPLLIRPVVEGDTILRWEDARTGAWILVAFRNDRVCDKGCSNPADQ